MLLWDTYLNIPDIKFHDQFGAQRVIILIPRAMIKSRRSVKWSVLITTPRVVLKGRLLIGYVNMSRVVTHQCCDWFSFTVKAHVTHKYMTMHNSSSHMRWIYIYRGHDSYRFLYFSPVCAWAVKPILAFWIYYNLTYHFTLLSETQGTSQGIEKGI